jgi:hypothetical protein
LNILKFDTTGACPESDQFRTPIKFGINMRSECKLSYSVPTNQDTCTKLQNYIDNVILGYDNKQRGSQYAPFANSLANETSAIINSNPAVDVSFQSLKRLFKFY